jgi:hypothetical protein
MVNWDVDMYCYFKKTVISGLRLLMEAAGSVASTSCNVRSKVSHKHRQAYWNCCASTGHGIEFYHL